jgi:hypothetical protein
MKITEQEFALVEQAVIQSESYVKQSNINPQKKEEMQRLFDDANQAMKAVNKRMMAAPDGGSAMSKDEKLKSLFRSFGVDKRIG